MAGGDVGDAARTYGERHTISELLRRRQSGAEAVAGRRRLCLVIDAGHHGESPRSCSALCWYAAGKFGLTWRLKQAVVKSREDISAVCQIDLGEDEKATINASVVSTNDESDDDEVQAIVEEDEEDDGVEEEEEEVVAPPPPPAKKRVIKKKAATASA